MNCFEEQIEACRKNDEEAIKNAYQSAVNAVVGESFSFYEAESAISTILSYYKIKDVKISDKITDENERIAEICRVSGLMRRKVKLTEGWYKNAFGAFLCCLKDTNEYVAVIPDKFGKYVFYDTASHRERRLNRKTEKLLSVNALCFYRSFPRCKLTFGDVIKFAVSSLNAVDYIITFILLGVATALGLLMPKLSSYLFSQVISEGDVTLLFSTVTFIVALSISILFLDSVKTLFNNRISVKIDATMQNASMIRVLSLPTEFFRQYSTGELSMRMELINSVFSGVIITCFGTVLSGVFSIAYITQIFRFTPSLVVPSVCVIAANILFSLYATIRQTKIARMQMEAASKANGKSVAIISGIQKIKMSGSEKRMFAGFSEDFSKQAKLLYNPPFFNKYSTVIATAISIVGTLAIYYVALKGNIRVADYYAFQTSYGMITAAFTGFATIALEIANLKPSMEMIKPILETLPEDVSNTYSVSKLSGNIEMNNVSFKYSDNSVNVIDDFSLQIKSGEYVAIVGKTGCGKSTLIRLLLGFEKPQHGSIYYDNMDLNTLDKRSLRRKIGTVMQDDKLFCGEIYSNIVICAPTLTMTDAWEAAEIAGVADDIRNMPMGMHTVITEGGGGISGGQRQRLAIARAIAPKPKILIFDEATSALDNITQKKVSEALDKLNCTRIVIAHRLSTIRHCDRILVMDKGKIVEEGTYEELVDRQGIFSELVDRQRLDK